MDKRFTATELLAMPVDLVAQLLSEASAAEAATMLEALAGYLRSAAAPESVAHIGAVLAAVRRPAIQAQQAQLLVDCCLYWYRVGRNADAIAAAEQARRLADELGDKALTRRCANMLGNLYRESLDFEASFARLDEALLLARELNDRGLETAVLANIGVTMLDMGLYRDAMRVNEQVLAHHPDTPGGMALRLQAIGNNLICSVRLRDSKSSQRYIAAGEAVKTRQEIDPVGAATFELYRAMHLIRENQADAARQLVEAARISGAGSHNPRAETLLTMATGVCEVAIGRLDIGMTRLRALYEKTRSTHLYHDDVLRALIEACERAGDTSRALAYTEELIEYTTHAKKAKYVEQMKAASTLVPVVGTGHDELEQTEADAAKLRLSALRQASAEYRTAENWAVVAELVDDQSGEHCFRVGRLAGLLAREIGCDEQLATQIEYAARLHDLGKIGISHALLLKPGRLSPSELAIVRTHTAIGAELLEGSADPVLKLAAQIARHHHEWWNGNGYPDGLTGESVPLAARMVSLAEVYDALTHDRPYRRAWSHHEAVAEIVSQQGSQFDPQLAAAFLRVLERYRKAGVSYTGDFVALARESSLLVARRRVAAAIG